MAFVFIIWLGKSYFYQEEVILKSNVCGNHDLILLLLLFLFTVTLPLKLLIKKINAFDSPTQPTHPLSEHLWRPPRPHQHQLVLSQLLRVNNFFLIVTLLNNSLARGYNLHVFFYFCTKKEAIMPRWGWGVRGIVIESFCAEAPTSRRTAQSWERDFWWIQRRVEFSPGRFVVQLAIYLFIFKVRNHYISISLTSY